MDWQTDNEGEGAWYKLNFRYEVAISRIRIMQLYSGYSSWKNITIQFDNNLNASFVLKKRSATNNADQSGLDWDDFFIDPVNASWVKIIFDSYYGKDYNGLKKIQILGRRSN